MIISLAVLCLHVPADCRNTVIGHVECFPLRQFSMASGVGPDGSRQGQRSLRKGWDIDGDHEKKSGKAEKRYVAAKAVCGLLVGSVKLATSDANAEQLRSSFNKRARGFVLVAGLLRRCQLRWRPEE